MRFWKATESTLKVASAHGGLIYVTITGGKSLGDLQVQLSGGILEAPYYMEGVSNPADWAAELAKPAPWGEVGSRKMATTAPTADLKTYVPNAQALASFYDTARCWLAGCAMGGLEG